MENDIETKLKEIDIKIDNCDDKMHEMLCKKKAELEAEAKAIDEYKLDGIILRSRCTWHEKGEKSNNYFLRLVSRNSQKANLNKLVCDGKDITNPTEILQMQVDYYKNLYTDKVTKTEDDIQNFLNMVNVPKLKDEEKQKCEGLISKLECLNALKTMKHNKTPGNDGLTVEFYKKFWDLISNLLVDCFNEPYEKGELSNSQTQAVITLLDKGSDRTQLKNWRPLSLLNVDYKIVSKVVATRIKQTLSQLINTDQAGYIKNRNIADCVRTIADVMFYTKQENIGGILMAVDFEKAFDSLNWKFLELTLKKFNFGPSLIQWIRTFYCNPVSCIMNKGFTSNYFQIKRGVRQGDPLSPYLFILVAEILASLIRQNKNIKGINLGGKHIKVQQYADDTNALLKDVASAKAFLNTVENFGTFSGLKLNREKTKGMWIGIATENHSVFHG